MKNTKDSKLKKLDTGFFQSVWQKNSFFIAAMLGNILYVFIPSFLLLPDYLLLSFYASIIIVLGVIIANRFPGPKLETSTIRIKKKWLFASIFALVLFKILLGEFSLFSFSEQSVQNYLDQKDQFSARGPIEILKIVIENYTLLLTLMYADKNRKSGAVLLIFLGLLNSSISRSNLAAYAATAFFVFYNGRLSAFRILIIISFGLFFFYISSIMRGDLNTSALGNVFFTAVGYPIINLSNLISYDISGSWFDYFIQLVIKPIPGFLFSPFGSKPVFNFNAEITTLISGSSISSEQPVSVFTFVAPLVYYKPILLTGFVMLIIYVIVFYFANYINNFRALGFYLAIVFFLIHRSNLLDFVSILIINIVTLEMIKLTCQNKKSMQGYE